MRAESGRLADGIDGLAATTEPGTPGWTRRVFTDPYRASRDETAARMRAVGLNVRVDGAGNVIGTLTGTGPSGGPALVTGSHTDTVDGGGRYDGVVGVVGAIEAVEVLRATGIRLHHELRVVDFLGEEPNRFGLSCVGSRAIAGHLSQSHLSLADDEGRNMAEGFASMGLDPSEALEAAWAPSEVKAFIELHIEQGPSLESAGVPLGVVSSIAGIWRLVATFDGRRDHAGTMPMDLRRDAACAAAEAVLAVERVAHDPGMGGGVGTTGRMLIEPGATNVVPERARLWTELRSTDEDWLALARRSLERDIAAAGARRNVGVGVEWVSTEPPTPMDVRLSAVVEEAVHRLGQPCLRLPSGAGHDAVQMASLGPAAMIFVPSVDGRSHCPEERTDVGDIVVGVEALAQALVLADQE